MSSRSPRVGRFIANASVGGISFQLSSGNTDHVDDHDQEKYDHSRSKRGRSGEIMRKRVKMDDCIETPSFVLPTSNALCPLISDDLLMKHFPDIRCFFYSFQSVLKPDGSISEHNLVPEFHSRVMFVSCSDATSEPSLDGCRPSGSNHISLAFKGGRGKIDVSKWKNSISTMLPSECGGIVVPIALGDEVGKSKRDSFNQVKYAVKRTSSLVSSCVDALKDVSHPKLNPCWIPLGGGAIEELRSEASEAVVKKGDDDVFENLGGGGGFVLVDLHLGGNRKEIRPLRRASLKDVRESAPVLELRSSSILDVLESVDDGVDLVCGDWIDAISSRGIALRIPIPDAEELTNVITRKKKNEIVDDVETVEEDVVAIVLDDAKYDGDTSLISDMCNCPTCCCGHTRGYIHHLFAVHELNGPMLLAMHNLWWYRNFFAEVRKAIRVGSWGEWKTLVSSLIKSTKRGLKEEEMDDDDDIVSRMIKERIPLGPAEGSRKAKTEQND